MKKILILFSYIFFLTGCSAEYNLIYEDNVFKEDLKLISSKNDKNINEINNNYNRNFFINYKLQLGDMSETEYINKYGGIYNKNIIDEDNNYGINLNYNYDKKENYLNSNIVFNLFEDFYVNENFIKASNIKNIFDSYDNLNSIKISFSTDKKVVKVNSDEEINGIYYWYIDKDNFKDKRIEIIMDESDEVLFSKDGYINGNVIKYILMGILILVLISIPIIYEKVRKSNI